MSFAEPSSLLTRQRAVPARTYVRAMLSAALIGLATGVAAQIAATAAERAAAGLMSVTGAGVILAVLFAWRWLNAGLCSQRDAKRLRAVSPEKTFDPEPYAGAHFWLTPVWGIAFRLSETVSHPTLSLLAIALGVAATVSLFAWTLRRLAEWRLGELAGPHAVYVALHHAMFVAGFVLTPNAVAGLILIEVWRVARNLKRA